MAVSDYASIEPVSSIDPGFTSYDPRYQPPATPAGQLASFAQPQGPVSSPNPMAQAPQAPPSPAPAQGAPLVGVPYQSPLRSEQGSTPALPLEDALKIYGTPPGGARKAGFVPTTQSETIEGKAYPKELEEVLGRSLGANREFASATMGSEALQGAAGRVKEAQAAIEQQKWAEEDRAYQKQQRDRIMLDKHHLEQTMADAQNYEENPGKWFGDMSTAGKILTGVSLGLKGFLYGYTRGQTQNPSDWIEQQIRNSVGKQREEHAAKIGTAQRSLSLYQLNKDALGDDDRAHLATTMATRQAVMARLDREANDAAAPAMSRLRAAQISADLWKSQQAAMIDFYDKTADKHTATMGQRYQEAGGGVVDPLTRLKRGVEAQGLVNKAVGIVEPKEAAEIRKTQAEATKAEAEAAGGGAAGKLSPRIAARLADTDVVVQAATDLDALLSRGSSLSYDDRRRATALAEVLRKAGHEDAIPEDPLKLIDNTGSRRKAVQTVLDVEQRKRDALLARGGRAGPSVGEEEAAP